ncbi:MAG: response regulator transcription factor [Chloroflexi bacterium]|nr:response regulator transcription factor [Chloroflexota bacterium]
MLSLEPGFKVVGQAANGAEALMMIRTLHPHVAVVDINLSGMNGQQVTHQVVQDKLSTRIVLFTAYGNHEQIIHAGWADAAAYCAKDIDPKQLVQTVSEPGNPFHSLSEREEMYLTVLSRA